MTEPSASERRKRRTPILLGGLALGMFGFGFALVPLYGLFCEVTGTQSLDARARVAAHPATRPGGPVDESRWVTVKLDATVHPDLPWRIDPAERKVRVHPGETRRVDFYAENRSGVAMEGQALPSIAPFQAGAFFSKLECFCFARQHLAGSERRVMPLVFTVSPDLPADIGSITLSYSVMRVPEGQPLAATR
jgi:cytochrome c oxidase assembly protein subunit 11